MTVPHNQQWPPPYGYEEEPKQVVILGNGIDADVAYELLTYDSPHDVVAFSVEQAYLEHDTRLGLPVVPFEAVEERYGPHRYAMFVAAGYARLNHVRARLYRQAKDKGYALVSYVSSQAFVWSSVEIGDNCLILERNVIQPFVRIGNNVTLLSGNHIGHGAVIRDHVYLTSHVVVSQSVDIGEHCLVGVNATIADGVKVGSDCLIGPGALMHRDARARQIYKAQTTRARGFHTLAGAAYDTFFPGEEGC